MNVKVALKTVLVLVLAKPTRESEPDYTPFLHCDSALGGPFWKFGVVNLGAGSYFRPFSTPAIHVDLRY